MSNVNKPPILDSTGQDIKSKLSAILAALSGAGGNYIPTSQKGAANGVAELGSDGKVPSAQLPSYVDDVLEYASLSAFPATGESGKIYVALDTNKTYRWSGSAYVEISPSLALGETSSTAYRGDRGKTAYDHSQSDHSTIAPAFTEAGTRANIATGESLATMFGKIKKFFTDLTANTNVTYPSGYGTQTSNPYKFGTNSMMQGNTFDVFTYAQNIADSLKTAINGHGDKLQYFDNNMADKADANGTYNKPIYDSTTHKFNLVSPETNKGAVYMANDAVSKLSTAINDHADVIDEATTCETETDTDLYLYRASKANGDRVYEEYVGGSVGWNQLVPNSGSSLSVTVQNGHKYIMKKSGTLSIGASTGTAITGLTGGTDYITDLTQLFGTTIADYAYTLETQTAGSGIQWLKEQGYFTKDYYDYNAGSIESVKLGSKRYVGKNLAFKKIDNATISNDGSILASTFAMWCAKVIKNVTYTITSDELFVGGFFYDEPVIGSVSYNNSRDVDTPKTFVAPIDGYVAFRSSANYATGQIEFGSQATTYEPYTTHDYPLGSDTLRGILDLENGKIVYKGDVKTSDGKMQRKYLEPIDLSSLNWIAYNGNRFYSSDDIGAKEISGVTCVCDKYQAVENTNSIDNVTTDKTICLYNSEAYKRIYIKDTNYSTAAALKTALNGVYLIAEAATPTTEQSTPFLNPQICDKDGTEEFINNQTIQIPVGHNSTYVKVPDWMEEYYPKDFRDRVDYPNTEIIAKQYVTLATGLRAWFYLLSNGMKMFNIANADYSRSSATLQGVVPEIFRPSVFVQVIGCDSAGFSGGTSGCTRICTIETNGDFALYASNNVGMYGRAVYM